MLHYFLTGDPRSREAALDLARWVLDMDDGVRTPFRWLTRQDTGLASSTVEPRYHGAGRGAGNSIVTLLNAWRLTGERRYLEKAERLIRRCINPSDDIEALTLLDVEARWSYTVFLQALGRYLDQKADAGEFDATYRYVRASLLHYATWMATRESPYLETPEKLEYPNETWAAQDMRKSEVFKIAARHTTGTLRARFLERSAFFFENCTRTLASMPTRTLARPLAILLTNGFSHAYFTRHPDTQAPAVEERREDFGAPERFIPQQIRARRRAMVVMGGLLLTAALGCVYLLLQ